MYVQIYMMSELPKLPDFTLIMLHLMFWVFRQDKKKHSKKQLKKEV